MQIDFPACGFPYFELQNSSTSLNQFSGMFEEGQFSDTSQSCGTVSLLLALWLSTSVRASLCLLIMQCCFDMIKTLSACCLTLFCLRSRNTTERHQSIVRSIGAFSDASRSCSDAEVDDNEDEGAINQEGCYCRQNKFISCIKPRY